MMETNRIEQAEAESKRLGADDMEVVVWLIYAPSMGHPGGVAYVVTSPGEDVASRPAAHRDRRREVAWWVRGGVMIPNYDAYIETRAERRSG